MTSSESTCGASSRTRITSGRGHVVGQVGHQGPRLAGSSPSSSAQSSRRASASTTRHRAARTTLAQHRDQAAVDLDRRHPGPGLGQGQRQRAEPGSDLDHRSPGTTSASRAMRRTVLGSATKFWPSARLGRRPWSASSRLDVRPDRGSQDQSGVRGPSGVEHGPGATRSTVRPPLRRSIPLTSATAAPTSGTNGRLVGPAPVGHRGEERAVGLDQQAVERAQRGRLADLGGVLEGHDPAERDDTSRRRGSAGLGRARR